MSRKRRELISPIIPLAQKLEHYKTNAAEAVRDFDRPFLKNEIVTLRKNLNNSNYKEPTYNNDVSDIIIVGVDKKIDQPILDIFSYKIGYIVRKRYNEFTEKCIGGHLQRFYTGKCRAIFYFGDSFNYGNYENSGILDFSTIISDLDIVRKGLADPNIGIDKLIESQKENAVGMANKAINNLKFTSKVDANGNINF